MILPSGFARPLGLWKDSGLIFQSERSDEDGTGELMLFNPNTGFLKNLGLGSLGFWIRKYTETFSSINY